MYQMIRVLRHWVEEHDSAVLVACIIISALAFAIAEHL